MTTDILVIQKNLVQLVTSQGKTNYDFPKDVVVNQEIKNAIGFQETIDKAISHGKTQHLLVIIGKSLTYEKETTNSGQSEFLDMVPFERVLSRVYTIRHEEFVVAVNNDFCEEIVHLFQSSEKVLIGLIPEVLIEKVYPQKTLLDIASKTDQLRKYSFIYFEEEKKPFITLNMPEKANIRFIGLLVTFGVLLIVLTFLLISQLVSSKKQQPTIPVKTTIHTVRPITTPIVSPSNTSVPTGEGQ